LGAQKVALAVLALAVAVPGGGVEVADAQAECLGEGIPRDRLGQLLLEIAERRAAESESAHPHAGSAKLSRRNRLHSASPDDSRDRWL
jgi:hypothetical protein